MAGMQNSVRTTAHIHTLKLCIEFFYIRLTNTMKIENNSTHIWQIERIASARINYGQKLSNSITESKAGIVRIS